MDGPSRGPGLSPVRCSVGSLGLFGREAAERGAVSAGATRQRGPAPPRPAPPPRAPPPRTSSHPLARGLLGGAHAWTAARRGAAAGHLVGRLGLGRRSLALGEEVCGTRAGQGGAARRGPRRVSFVYGAPRGAVSAFPLSRGRAPGRHALHPRAAGTRQRAGPGRGAAPWALRAL